MRHSRTFPLCALHRHILLAFVSAAVLPPAFAGNTYTYYVGHGEIGEPGALYQRAMLSSEWEKYLDLKKRGDAATNADYWNVANASGSSSAPADERGANIRQFVSAVESLDSGWTDGKSRYLVNLGGNSLVLSNERDPTTAMAIFITPNENATLEYQGDGTGRLDLNWSLQSTTGRTWTGYYQAIDLYSYNNTLRFKDIDLNVNLNDTTTDSKSKMEGIAVDPQYSGETLFQVTKRTDIRVKSGSEYSTSYLDRVAARGVYVATGSPELKRGNTSFKVTAGFNDLSIATVALKKAVGITSRMAVYSPVEGGSYAHRLNIGGALDLSAYSSDSNAEGLVAETLYNAAPDMTFVNTFSGDAHIGVRTDYAKGQVQGIKQTAVNGGRVETVFNAALRIDDRVRDEHGAAIAGENAGQYTGIYMGSDARISTRIPLYEDWATRGFSGYSNEFEYQKEQVYDALTGNGVSSNSLTVTGPVTVEATSHSTEVSSATGLKMHDNLRADSVFTAKSTMTVTLAAPEGEAVGVLGVPEAIDLVDNNLENYLYTPQNGTPTDLLALAVEKESIKNSLNFEGTVTLTVSGVSATGLADRNVSSQTVSKRVLNSQNKFFKPKDANGNYITRTVVTDHKRQVDYRFRDHLEISASATKQDALGISLDNGVNGAQTVSSVHSTNIRASSGNGFALGVYLSSAPASAINDSALITGSAEDGKPGSRVHLEGPTSIEAKGQKGSYAVLLDGALSHLGVNAQHSADSIVATGDMDVANGATNTWYFGSDKSRLTGSIVASSAARNTLTFTNGALWHGQADLYTIVPNAAPAMMLMAASAAATNPETAVHQKVAALKALGDAAGTNSVTLDASRWEMTGTSYLSSLDMSADGVADMRADADGYSYLVTRDLTGSGGTIRQNIDVRSMESDKVLVYGTFTGEQYLDIYQKDDYRPAADDYTEGVDLVLARVAAGNGVFKAKDRPGTLFYTHYDLDQKPSEYAAEGIFATDWYLKRATRVDPEEKPTPSVVSTPAVHKAIYLGWRQDIDKLLQRMGELRHHDFNNEGLWGRAKGSRFTYDGAFGAKTRFNTYEIGYDRKWVVLNDEGKDAGLDEEEISKDKVKEENTPNRFIERRRYRGASVNFTDASVKYSLGRSSVDGFGLSLYQSDMYTSRWYRDLILRYNYYDYSHRTTGFNGETLTGDDNVHALSASIEGGRKYQNDKRWYIEPQAQAVLGWMSGMDYTLSNGTRVETDSTLSLIGRAGVNIGREFKEERGLFYAKLNVLHEFLGEGSTWYGYQNETARVITNYRGTWFQYGLGLTYRFDKEDDEGRTVEKGNRYFYFDVERNAGKHIGRNWQWNVGFRYMF